MATIEQDGLYQVGDEKTGSRFQFRKGQVVPDDVEIKKVGEFPVDDAKAEPAPANKADAAPSNKETKA